MTHLRQFFLKPAYLVHNIQLPFKSQQIKTSLPVSNSSLFNNILVCFHKMKWNQYHYNNSIHFILHIFIYPILLTLKFNRGGIWIVLLRHTSNAWRNGIISIPGKLRYAHAAMWNTYRIIPRKLPVCALTISPSLRIHTFPIL